VTGFCTSLLTINHFKGKSVVLGVGKVRLFSLCFLMKCVSRCVVVKFSTDRELKQ
jgi:hypothetical protein